MIEPFFFAGPRQITLAEVVALAASHLPDGASPNQDFDAVMPLRRAGPRHIACVYDGSEAEDLLSSRAGACLVKTAHLPNVPHWMIPIETADPAEAFRRVFAVLYAEQGHPPSPHPAHNGAFVHPSATLEADVKIDFGAVVGPWSMIGAGTLIGAHAVVGMGVHIGRGCTIGPHATLSHALVGDRVVVQPGARLGHFDLAPAALRIPRMPYLGRVIIQDDAEIGANSVIARARVDDTVIGEGAVIEACAEVPSGTTIDRFRRVDARRAERADRPTDGVVSRPPGLV